ncbi:MAG: sulfatase [Defluviitaleaceae bacterium]|nr:sulfatase [Defluviitaleaceae bacterium]
MRKPNIILINADDLGYGDLSCYGSAVNDTPHLDKMAAEGLRFTDFYTASPACSPSRGALLTGCYPKRFGFGSFDGRAVLYPGQGCGLHSNEVTIAKLLKTVNYNTKCVGKWHCGDQPGFLPNDHGFDSYYGIPFSNDMGRQNGRGHPLPLMCDASVIEQQPDQTTLTARYTEESVRFIRENRSTPFFLYLAHFHVHLPHYAPERFLRESRNGRFGAALASMDWSTGVILNELKAMGIDENTLVIFTSDNGARITEGGSNAPLRGAKTTMWEGGLRVPCIARWPGVIKPGVSSGIAACMDFFPTFARIAGAEISDDRVIDGFDMMPLFKGQTSNRTDFAYYAADNLCALRKGDWKLHTGRGLVWDTPKPVLELYNLADDIGETMNVYDEHPNIVSELRQLMEKYRETLGDAVTNSTGRNIRPIGRVNNPKPLTEYDPAHPYYIAMYDLTEQG